MLKTYTNTIAAEISKQDVSMTHLKQADHFCSQQFRLLLHTTIVENPEVVCKEKPKWAGKR